MGPDQQNILKLIFYQFQIPLLRYCFTFSLISLYFHRLLQALAGGYMKYGHFEMIRFAINRYIGTKKNVFAEWRVPAPFKSVTRRGQGTRMGGGKGE